MITKYKLFENKYNKCSDVIGVNHFNDFKKLICNGECDINATNKKGVSLLSMAIFHMDYDIIKYLLESGADINISSTSGNQAINGLGFYIYNNVVTYEKDMLEIKVLKLLLKYGANLSHKNKSKKDFFDLIYGNIKKQIILEIPDDYNKYLITKKTNEYNI